VIASSPTVASLGWAIALVLIVGCLAFSIWAIVDAARKPNEAWRAAGKSKVLWIVLIAVPLGIVPPLAPIMAFLYVVAIRSRVVSAQFSMPPPLGAGSYRSCSPEQRKLAKRVLKTGDLSDDPSCNLAALELGRRWPLAAMNAVIWPALGIGFFALNLFESNHPETTASSSWTLLAVLPGVAMVLLGFVWLLRAIRWRFRLRQIETRFRLAEGPYLTHSPLPPSG